ncbi:MAG: M42 family peptidase, partial [Ruminococcus sp.]|nr:M42 family peptidase [Ruminococcus sp.]
MNKVTELLEELTTAVGVSGSEENICDLLCEMLKPYGEVSRDSMNNVYCTFGHGYHFMLDAHLDEIGFIVTEITDDGFIKFDKCGGIDTRSLPASEVSIWGTQEIKGIISTLPPHLQNDDDSKNAPKISDLSIDTGLRKDELEKIVSLGDKITFNRNFNVLLNNRISGSCLDDRAGVCSILLALDKLKNLPCKITVMFSSQEEVGTRGAKIGTYSRNVDE